MNRVHDLLEKEKDRFTVNHELKIGVVTWNVANQLPQGSLDWLFNSDGYEDRLSTCNVLAVG